MSFAFPAVNKVVETGFSTAVKLVRPISPRTPRTPRSLTPRGSSIAGSVASPASTPRSMSITLDSYYSSPTGPRITPTGIVGSAVSPRKKTPSMSTSFSFPPETDSGELSAQTKTYLDHLEDLRAKDNTFPFPKRSSRSRRAEAAKKEVDRSRSASPVAPRNSLINNGPATTGPRRSMSMPGGGTQKRRKSMAMPSGPLTTSDRLSYLDHLEDMREADTNCTGLNYKEILLKLKNM